MPDGTRRADGRAQAEGHMPCGASRPGRILWERRAKQSDSGSLLLGVVVDDEGLGLVAQGVIDG